MQETDDINLAENATYIDRYMINSEGQVVSNTAYRYTPAYTKVEPNTTYNVSMDKTDSASYWFTVPIYDSNYNFIERLVAIGSNTGLGIKTGSFTTTQNTQYIRFTVPYYSKDITIVKVR